MLPKKRTWLSCFDNILAFYFAHFCCSAFSERLKWKKKSIVETKTRQHANHVSTSRVQFLILKVPGRTPGSFPAEAVSGLRVFSSLRDRGGSSLHDWRSSCVETVTFTFVGQMDPFVVPSILGRRRRSEQQNG